MTPLRLSPALDRTIVTIFLVAIFVPFLGTLAGVREDAVEDEFREAAAAPGFPHDVAALAAWPGAFTKYFSDNFAFRSRLVESQARVRVVGLRSSPTADVILGQHGWLFYGTDGAVEDYAGVRRFADSELEAWRATLQHTHDWLADRHIPFVFVIAPDKHWIYPDQMPATINRYDGGRVDQLLQYLRQRSTVPLVDPRPALVEARATDRVYHVNDTHWNDLGAFVAYQQVMDAIGPAIGIHGRKRQTLELRVIPRTGFDLGRMLGLRSVLVEEDLQLEPIEGRRSRVVEPPHPSRALMYPRVVTEGPPAGPRAVVFRDSFASAMIPFLSEHFSRVVYVWQNNFDPELVETEHPDVVIQEWVGRHLYTATPFDSVAALAVGQQ